MLGLVTILALLWSFVGLYNGVLMMSSEVISEAYHYCFLTMASWALVFLHGLVIFVIASLNAEERES